jgi:hypothetical protein
MQVYRDQRFSPVEEPTVVVSPPTTKQTDYAAMTFQDRAIEGAVITVIATMYSRRVRTWHDIAHIFVFVTIALYLCDTYVPTMSEGFRASTFAALAFSCFDSENFFMRWETGGSGNLIHNVMSPT